MQNVMSQTCYAMQFSKVQWPGIAMFITASKEILTHIVAGDFKSTTQEGEALGTRKLVHQPHLRAPRTRQ